MPSIIDRSFPEDNLPTRKPGTAMLTKYMDGDYDLAHSYVIGDRQTDARLAENLGCRSLILGDGMDWQKIAELLFAGERTASVRRTTKETDIEVTCRPRRHRPQRHLHRPRFLRPHARADSPSRHDRPHIRCCGDLHVDEHHTIEDTALALGECIRKALGDKRGIERYGYCLPMDDCLCQVALDFGGRPWLVWDAEFHREKVGEMPTEMFLHFFKSLSDSAA